MRLTRLEKERIADSRLKIQSISNSLKHVDPKKVHAFDNIRHCLEEAEHSLGGALKASESGQP
jgi:hypothetical protein